MSSQAEDPDRRRDPLEELFRIWRWDIHFGGAGISDNAANAMVTDTAAEERALLAGWARAVLPSLDPGSLASGWRQEAIGGFLLELEADLLDDESFLRICRETGRTRDLAARLFSLGRIEEATDAARQLFHSYHTDLAVAKAAEATRPEAAIHLYLDAANSVIQLRNRGSYAEAAEYLTRVRDLLRKSGQADRWTALIAQIRYDNRRLRALQDELNRAGL